MTSKQPATADFILTAAIGLVAVLVLALVFVLQDGRQHYDRAVAARLELRALRITLIDFTRAQSAVTEAETSFLLTGEPQLRSAFESAAADARAAAAEAIRASAADPEGNRTAGRLAATTEDLIAHLDALMRPGAPRLRRDSVSAALIASLEADTAALHESILRRSESINRAEAEARARTDSIANALALLSLITAVLSSLALLRERAQWRLANQAAEEARARAAASDLAKTRFLAVASHDMRQPLHALTLYLSALERRVETAEARDIIAKMDRATQSMVGMFAMLLDLARIQAGVVQPERRIVRLQELLDRVVAQYPGSAVYAPATELRIETDPLLLDRILNNLVSNALKHGGGKARILVSQHGDDVEIVVADDGPGIAPDDQKRIFEEFVRLETRAEGLGLGLAIVKRIAHLLDMPLRLESAPGAGARFVLTAPLSVAACAPNDDVTADAAALAGARILIVDDEASAREAVGGAMRDLGAEVRVAASETEAQAALRDFTPTLLLMDLRIDGQLEGIDIAKRLSSAIQPAPRTVVITGDTAADTLALLRASGFSWLIKPVDPGLLARTAAAALA